MVFEVDREASEVGRKVLELDKKAQGHGKKVLVVCKMVLEDSMMAYMMVLLTGMKV